MKNFLALALLTISFLLFADSVKAQNLDSLHQIWLDETQPDTARFKAMKTIAWDGYLFSNPDSANILAQQLEKLAKQKENKKWEAGAMNVQGASFWVRSDFAPALELFLKSIKLFEEINFQKGVANSLHNIANIYNQQGNFKEAMENYLRSLKIREEIGDKKGIASSLNSLGGIYKAQGNSKKALEYFERSLILQEEFGSKQHIANALANIGSIHDELGNLKEALKYCDRSLKLREEIGDKNGMSSSLLTLGNINYSQDSIKKTLECYNRSLQLREEIGNKEGVSQSLTVLALFYSNQGKFREALNYSTKALILAQELGLPKQIEDAARILSGIYENLGNDKKALETYKLYIQMRDSINNDEAKKGLLKMEVQHQFEKDQIIKQQEEEEAARIEAEKIEQRNTLQFAGIGIGIFALFGLVFFIGRIKLPKWAVELSVFLPFLIFFEFLLVITDGAVEAWSNGEPAVKLLLNVIMAGAIFPMHSFFEGFLKKRLFRE